MRMYSVKKAVIFLFAVSLLFLSGCGSITYTYMGFTNGKVAEIIDFEFDTNVIKNPQEVQQARGIVMLEAGLFAKEHKLELTFATVPDKPNKISVLLIYENAASFEKIRSIVFGEAIKEDGLFFNKHYIFKDMKNVYEQNQKFISELEAKYTANGFDNTFKYFQQMVSGNGIVRSDAELVERSGNAYLHTWQIEEKTSLSMFVENPNTKSWYLLGLILTLFVFVSGMAVYKLKVKSHNSRQQV